MSSFNTSVAISGFTLNLHPVSVAGENPQTGQPIARSEKRGLAVHIANYNAVNKYLGDSPVLFDDVETPAKPDDGHTGLVPYRELMVTDTGVDIEEAFDVALFDVVKAKWPEFDPAASPGGEIPRYIRLDRVEATLPLHQPADAQVQAVVGIYGLPSYKHVLAYLRIQFLGGHRLRQRQDGIDQLNAAVADAEARLAASTDPTEQKQIQAQIDDWNRQLTHFAGEYVAPLTDLLAVVEIKDAVGAMSIEIWKELKAKHVSFVDLDLAAKEANYSGYYDMLVASVA